MSLREIGRIRLVQVQRSSLKAGERPNRYYDPAPLLVVDGLLLSPSGVVGQNGGEHLVDVHNAEHPSSKNVRGVNGVSVGFTSHYREMRDRFGPHLTDGIAGENILVESDHSFALADLGQRLVIQTSSGALVHLGELLVAAPCNEFSQFAASQGERMPPEMIKAALQFLNDGRRGFYATLATPTDAVVRAGDLVFSEF